MNSIPQTHSFCCPVCCRSHKDGYLDTDLQPVQPRAGTITVCIHCAAVVRFEALPLFGIVQRELCMADLVPFPPAVRAKILRLRCAVRSQLCKLRQAHLEHIAFDQPRSRRSLLRRSMR